MTHQCSCGQKFNTRVELIMHITIVSGTTKPVITKCEGHEPVVKQA